MRIELHDEKFVDVFIKVINFEQIIKSIYDLIKKDE